MSRRRHLPRFRTLRRLRRAARLEATVIDDALVELGERRKNFRAMPRTAICSRSRSASTERCPSACGDLLRLQILLVRGQGPGMPKWISKDTVSIAPEHIFQRHAHLRAGGHRSAYSCLPFLTGRLADRPGFRFDHMTGEAIEIGHSLPDFS